MNLRKERWFLGNIVIKCSFQMTLMRMKNLVYNKLGKENILHFVNSISILVIVTYFYHYSNSSYYYYYYSYNYYFFLLWLLLLLSLLLLLQIVCQS